MIMNHGGNELWSLGFTFRRSRHRSMGTSDVARDLGKGGPSILLEFSIEVHQKLGHDKAYPCFAHISRSTLWSPAKIGIVGKL